jgi:hypothetical protein
VIRGRLAGSLLATLVLAAGAAPAADEIEVQLVGFLVAPAEARTPATGTALAGLDVPNEQGGARIFFHVEITRATTVALPGGRPRFGELVVLSGLLATGRVRAHRIAEIDVVELSGRVRLGDGVLDLPVARDRLLDVYLDGSSTPVAFLLLPKAASVRRQLRDSQPVTLAVVSGTRLIVGIEPR